MATRSLLIVCATLMAAGALAGASCGGTPFDAGTGAGTASGSGGGATTGGGGPGGSGSGGSAASTGPAGGAGGMGGAASASSSSASSGGASSSASAGGGGAGGSAVCQGIGDPCSDCAYNACMGLYCPCYADQDCAAIVACFNQCGANNPPCQQNCMSAHPDHISEAFILGDCAAGSCAQECPGVITLDPCSMCLFTSCPAQMNTCLSDPECAALAECALMCAGNQICIFGCGQQHPNGQAKALGALQCMNSSCSAECN